MSSELLLAMADQSVCDILNAELGEANRDSEGGSDDSSYNDSDCEFVRVIPRFPNPRVMMKFRCLTVNPSFNQMPALMTNQWQQKTKTLHELCFQFVRPLILRRQQNSARMSKAIALAIECMVGEMLQPRAEGVPKTAGNTLQRCFLCPRKKDRKSRQYCVLCKQSVCSEHSEKKAVCKSCA